MKSSSPVSGLRRAQLSFTQVLGQSVSAVAPSAVMVTLPALVIPAAGSATLPVFIVTAVLMAAVGYCVRTMWPPRPGELRDESSCVAVPVRSATGALVAAVAMSGRSDQAELLSRQVPVLRECATRLSPLLA